MLNVRMIMKKYGIQRQHQHGYPDNHPKKGMVNWWELENHSGKSKKRARQEARKEIEIELSSRSNKKSN